MRSQLVLGLSAIVCGLGLAAPASAQVFVRAPFVRVEVGPGVSVRAPFVNLYIPPAGVPGPIYGNPGGPIFGPRPFAAPPSNLLPPAGQIPQFRAPMPTPQGNAPPMPPAVNNEFPAPQAVPTLEAFARSFQPKAGTYEVTVLNPVTNQPSTVRFNLPEGAPRRIITNRSNLEFVYGPRQFVRIEFDRDGAQVTSRQ